MYMAIFSVYSNIFTIITIVSYYFVQIRSITIEQLVIIMDTNRADLKFPAIKIN